MIRRRYKEILAFTLVLSISCMFAKASQSQEVFYTVSGEHFRCLVENREKYIVDPRDNLLIPLSDCPEFPSPPLSILNSGADGSAEVDSKTDSFIYVTKDEFTCLIPEEISEFSDPVLIFPATCEIR